MTDTWTIFDAACATLNITAVYMISNVPAETYLPSRKAVDKEIIDYFMVLVLVVTWLRFFVYFLVVRKISKLILTLVAMIGDTLSFLFLVCCFILITASVFTTLYQEAAPEKFNTLTLTIRTLYDAALGNYDYEMTEEREISYTVLLVSYVFFSNIMLLNFLIAILSTTYEMMQQDGVFRYKVNLYTYCQKFIIPFQDRIYGELLLHPPPLTYSAIVFILPTFCSNRGMENMSYLFSQFMYWLENIVFGLFFFTFELLLCLPTYFKVFHNIVLNAKGGKLALYLVIWLFLGFFITIFIVLEDMKHLFKIFFETEGFKDQVEQLNQE